MLLRNLISDEMSAAASVRQWIAPEVRAAAWSVWNSGLPDHLGRAEARLAAVRLRNRLDMKLTDERLDELADDMFEQEMEHLGSAYSVAMTRMRVAACECLRGGGNPGQAAQAALRSVSKLDHRPPPWALDKAIVDAIRIYTRERAPSRRRR